MITIEEFKRLSREDQLKEYLNLTSQIEENKREINSATKEIEKGLADLSDDVNNLMDIIGKIKEKQAEREAEYGGSVSNLSDVTNELIRKCKALSSSDKDDR